MKRHKVVVARYDKKVAVYDSARQDFLRFPGVDCLETGISVIFPFREHRALVIRATSF